MKNTYNIIPDASVEILRQLRRRLVEGISVEQNDMLAHALSQMVYWSPFANEANTLAGERTQKELSPLFVG